MGTLDARRRNRTARHRRPDKHSVRPWVASVLTGVLVGTLTNMAWNQIEGDGSLAPLAHLVGLATYPEFGPVDHLALWQIHNVGSQSLSVATLNPLGAPAQSAYVVELDSNPLQRIANEPFEIPSGGTAYGMSLVTPAHDYGPSGWQTANAGSAADDAGGISFVDGAGITHTLSLDDSAHDSIKIPSRLVESDSTSATAIIWLPTPAAQLYSDCVRDGSTELIC